MAFDARDRRRGAPDFPRQRGGSRPTLHRFGLIYIKPYPIERSKFVTTSAALSDLPPEPSPPFAVLKSNFPGESLSFGNT